MLRIRDLGLPIGNSGRRGDLYIKLNIYLPYLTNENIKELTRLSFLEKPKSDFDSHSDCVDDDNNIFTQEIIATI